ncbi:MAG: 6-phosphofructokinase [Chloroflexi bacterium]|nr:6-phosphofructokinase [Chloroflexota bacterium]
MKKVAILTSGGDAPGMNAAIRAAVRVALWSDIGVMGVKWGFTGLIKNDLIPLDARSVGGIIQRGGTILGTARSEDFRTEAGKQQALENLRLHDVEGLIAIGGDGTMHGALALHALGLPTIGVPATIDNDLSGTEMAIGVDTALNTAIEAIDRIKDTASSHQRAFVIEVMGRDCGYLALTAGMAAGAEVVLIPEMKVELKTILYEMKKAYARGKPHFIVVVAEGAEFNATDVADYLSAERTEVGFELRPTILGHVQRGGSPTAFDRILATRLGAGAVTALAEGKSGKMVCLVNGNIETKPLGPILASPRKMDEGVMKLAKILAT